MNIYVGRGGEDVEFIGGAGTSLVSTAGHFRSGKARCSMVANVNAVWRNRNPFSAATFWFSAVPYNQFTALSANSRCIVFLDANGVSRLYLTSNGANSSFRIFKVDAAGTATQLGSDFTFVWPTAALLCPKLDIYVDYQASGAVRVYSGGAQLFSFSGDPTTNSVTALAYVQLGSHSNSGNSVIEWSEVMVLDVDTRALSLCTWGAVANGNTHNFDTGVPAAANINEITCDDTTLDGSTTAGQIDQYTTGAVPSGVQAVLAYGVSARAVSGITGPSKLDLGLRLSGADYWSADLSISQSAWGHYSNDWFTNPATGVAFLTSEIGNAAGFNIGAKSVT